jgi:hypothetical protein
MHEEPTMDADPQVPTVSQFLRSYAFRVGVYGVITFLVFHFTYLAIQAYGGAVMGAENGPIEMAQLTLAILAAAGLFCAARWTRIGRAGVLTCGAVVAYAAARESDLILETYLFDDAYKWVVGLPLAVLVVVVSIADRRRLVGDAIWLFRQPAATLFAVAGIYLCFVCQFFDRPGMWVGISSPAEAKTTNAMVEEFAELFAYLLLMFSGFEAAIVARQHQAAAACDQRGEEGYPRIAA